MRERVTEIKNILRELAPAATDSPADSWASGPATRAEIAFADASGQPIPGLMHGATDTNGAYGVFKLPQGFNFVIQATLHTPDGKAVTRLLQERRAQS